MVSKDSKLILSVRQGGKSFSQNEILRDIDIHLQEGDFLSILGPSGSGKSTILRLLAGLENWTSGEQVENSDLSRAFVFQDPNLLNWRTTLENATLPLELQAHHHSRSSSDLETQGLEALKMVQLESAALLYPHELSGGMKMRTSLARAFITKPKLLFMDEPFAALDEPTRETLQEQLRDLWKHQQATIVFVTHSLQEALFLSNRIILLHGKPASIHKELQISLPESRKASIRTTPAYFQALTELRECMQILSQKEKELL